VAHRSNSPAAQKCVCGATAKLPIYKFSQKLEARHALERCRRLASPARLDQNRTLSRHGNAPELNTCLGVIPTLTHHAARLQVRAAGEMDSARLHCRPGRKLESARRTGSLISRARRAIWILPQGSDANRNCQCFNYDCQLAIAAKCTAAGGRATPIVLDGRRSLAADDHRGDRSKVGGTLIFEY
jgi:hypothetical protein